ncbi:14-3-3 protein, partial [Lunasporangiospora selenospora]
MVDVMKRIAMQGQKEASKDADAHVAIAKSCRAAIEKELTGICEDVLAVLTDHLLKHADGGESKVFYYKMKGDYFRYLAEFSEDDKRKEAANDSLEAYK